MEEIEKIDDAKIEKIIEEKEDTNTNKNIIDINSNIKQRSKYKNISNEKYNEIDDNKCFGFHKNYKNKLKVIFCPCYCLFYKSFKWIWDGRCQFETYYKSHYFIENIFFCLLSIIDIVALSFYKDNLSTAFLVIRIISDFFGILIFWLTIVLWDEDGLNENHFESSFLFLTFLDLILMGVLDMFSFIAFCASNSEFLITVLMSFLMHLILSVAIISFNLCKYMH